MSSITRIITDEPTEDDVLDFSNYSQKLADIIGNSTPRFAIGVFGGWGTGKTSLMQMTKKILDHNSKIVTVWFDAWRYEREQNLAVIPFLRTIKLTLDASEKSKEGKKWEGVKNSIKRSAAAFLTSTKITYGVKDVVSAETDFEKVADSLKGDGTVGDDVGNIYYYVTQFLEKALKDLREQDTNYRVVVFIDDLDRCSPDRSLEVLESIKSFFDIEGIVYVIGMDSDTINSLVKKKYGQESAVKGLDYLQKIVQLPFQIPTWKEIDISSSISKIISKGLGSSKLAEEFENNKSLIVKAVELNPRQVKRFINNIILAESVFDKPVDELIAVQALNFRHDWRKFLDLISPNDDRRKMFFSEYKKIKEEGKVVTTEAELNKLIEAISENNHPLLKDVADIYRELVKQDYSLRDFLDAGAQEVLERIKKMEEHRRALDTAKLPPSKEEEQQDISSKTVFISYAAEDSKFAERLSQDLKNAGLVLWRDKDAIRMGENWKIGIRKAIKNCRYFIPLFSSKSVEKIGYIQKEFKYAIDNYDKFPESQIYIIPARLDDCQIPYENIQDIQYVDLFPDWDKGLTEILKVIRIT